MKYAAVFLTIAVVLSLFAAGCTEQPAKKVVKSSGSGEPKVYEIDNTPQAAAQKATTSTAQKTTAAAEEKTEDLERDAEESEDSEEDETESSGTTSSTQQTTSTQTNTTTTTTTTGGQTGGSAYTTSTGNTYYVGKTGCSDSGSGSKAAPFCTINAGIGSLSAGDTLLILAGTYYEYPDMTDVSGTFSAPITVRGESRDSVFIDGGCGKAPCRIADFANAPENLFNIKDSSNIVIKDLTLQNHVMFGFLAEGGSNIVVDNIHMRQIGNGGIIIVRMSGVKVINNELDYTGLGYYEEDGTYHYANHETISIVGADDFEVYGNKLYDNIKEGICVKESAYNGKVHDNNIERVCPVGIYIDEAKDVSVYKNDIAYAGYYKYNGNVIECGSIPEVGFGKWFGTGIQLATGDLGELSKGKLSNIDVYQNKVWNCHLNGFAFWDELRQSGTGIGEIKDNKVYNNVFYKCGSSYAGAGMSLFDSFGNVIANNIFAYNTQQGIYTEDASQSTVTNNLFYGNGDDATVGENAVTDDPLFVDAANGNFKLTAGSPAIDAGYDMGAGYSGSAPDIGAYEYG